MSRRITNLPSLFIVLFILLSLGWVSDTWSSLSGKVHCTKKPVNQFFEGCLCHSPDGVNFGPQPSVRIWFTGPDSLNPGQSATYRVWSRKDSLIAGGFNVAAYFGTLSVTDTVWTRLEDGELTHTQPRTRTSRDTVFWTFRYTAPNRPGARDTLYAAANDVDTSYDPNGDFWNFSPNFVVRVTGTSSVSENLSGTHAKNFSLSQNYPNPFNPSTGIRYQISGVSDVRLEVFDVLGRKVATLVNERQAAGSYQTTFNASSLASGTYLYRLEARALGSPAGVFSQTKKMLLVK
jgi:hypothetical protein